MGRKKKNLLLGMTANEKKFMRKIVEVLEKNNVHKSEHRERKQEALETYRERVRQECSQCFSDVVDTEIDRLLPTKREKAVKKAIEEKKS